MRRRQAVLVPLLALAAALPASATAGLVIGGYPYARQCPEAGRRDDVDRWQMNTCNCTSYVAWALFRNGYRTDWFVKGRMDAWEWPRVARKAGIPTGRVPRAGSVAVWGWWGKFGHVAFVTAVNPDGTFDVAEYNTPNHVRFGFDKRSGLSAQNLTFVYVPYLGR